jgi:hypothetical protein
MRLLEQSSFALEEGPVEMKISICAAEGIITKKTYTERFLSSLMALISIFLLPIAAAARRSCGLFTDCVNWSRVSDV